MNKNLIKLGFGVVTMFGVDEIVGNVVKYVNPQKMNVAKKICVGVASMAISGCICSAVNKYIDETIDEVFDFVEGLITKKDENTEDNVIHLDTEEA